MNPRRLTALAAVLGAHTMRSQRLLNAMLGAAVHVEVRRPKLAPGADTMPAQSWSTG